jgi:hypothetical protein
LCCNLLFWVLVALFIAVGVRRWGYFGGRAQLPGRRETLRVGIVGELIAFLCRVNLELG